MVIAASIVGFTAYTWLLRVATPAAVGTYGFVTPVVALVVGWAIGGEALTARTLAAAALTITGVAAILDARPSSVRAGTANALGRLRERSGREQPGAG